MEDNPPSNQQGLSQTPSAGVSVALLWEICGIIDNQQSIANIIDCYQLKQIMGSSISLDQYKVSHLENQHLWELEAQKEHCKIYRNLQTGSLCDEYILQLPPGKIKEDINIYEDRFLTLHNNIVKVYYINYEHSPALCSNSDVFRVRTEPIPYRLNELSPLSTSESLFVLMETYSGFAEIVYRYSFVRIDPEMIGLSSDGKIKVWLNPNYSKCYAEDHSIFKNQDNESSLVNDMIREIYQIVERQSRDKQILSPNIRSRILKSTNFQNAMNIIRESISADRLAMTSVSLPGNSLKQTQLDRTKYAPVSATLPNPLPLASTSTIPPLDLNRDQIHQARGGRHSLLQMEQPRTFRGGRQSQIVKPNSSLQKTKATPHNSHNNSNQLPSSPPTMPNEFPAEFVQSQLIRQPKSLSKIKNPDPLIYNPGEGRSSVQKSKPVNPERQSEYFSSTSHHNTGNTQNHFQNNLKLRELNTSPIITKNRHTQSRGSFKLQPILQNSVHNNSLNQTARFTLQPSSSTPRLDKGIPLNKNPNYYGSENFTINVIPPSRDSKLRQINREEISLNNQYVNSSYVPNVLKMSPSEVVNSTPVGMFSNIQYGHGVVRNRQPRNWEE